MAFLVEFNCSICKNRKKQLVGAGKPDPHICEECNTKEKLANRNKYFEELDKLPIEERLRQIEKWIYDIESKPSKVSLKDMRF